MLTQEDKEAIAEIVKSVILDNVPDYAEDFKGVLEAIAKDKVDLPALKELTLAVQNLVNVSKLGTRAILMKQLIDKVKTKPTKETVLTSIKLGLEPSEVYVQYKLLSDKDKKMIFDLLAKNDMPFLKQLVAIASAEKIVKQLKGAEDKDKMFRLLHSEGKINKDNLALIKHGLA